MSKKLYVGNLSYEVRDSALTRCFSAYGTVESATVITDRETGRSKGFGFVEMASEEEARAAMEALDGNELEGRAIRVNEAKPREDRPQQRGGGRRGW